MAPGERLDFEAPIEEGRGGGAFVRLPADAARIFGTRVRFGVQVTFNGLPYRGSTMPMGDGTFCVGVTKAIRAQAGVGIGDSVAVQLRRDDEERSVAVPPDLAEALSSSPQAGARFDAMSYTQRKEFAAWIASAKKPETRHRRLSKALAMIEAGTPLS